jgi:hypothetical protein
VAIAIVPPLELVLAPLELELLVVLLLELLEPHAATPTAAAMAARLTASRLHLIPISISPLLGGRFSPPYPPSTALAVCCELSTRYRSTRSFVQVGLTERKQSGT